MKKTKYGTRILRTFALLFAAVLMAVPAAFATTGAGGEYPADVSGEIRFEPSDLTFSHVTCEDGITYDVIRMGNEGNLELPGLPDLPYVTKRFVVPTKTNIKDVRVEVLEMIELPGTYRIMPAQEPVKTREEPIPPFVPPDPAVYLSTDVFPRKIAGTWDEGFFKMDHIATVVICPFQYNPLAGKLYLVKRLNVRLTLEDAEQEVLARRSIIAKSQWRHDSILRKMVENEEDIYGFRPPSHAGVGGNGDNNLSTGEATQYLIITNKELAPAFESLRFHRWTMGMPAEIVLVSNIVKTCSGEDTQAKIRNYIINRYAWDPVDFVLLGGGEDVVPVRYAYKYDTNTKPEIKDMQVCDLYFSDLTGDWDVDGDGVYGEPTHDDPDIFPEVYVGRVPASSQSEVIAWFNKLETFETDPVGIKVEPGHVEEIYDHLTRALFIAADQMVDYNQPALVAEAFPPHFLVDTERCVEQPSGSDPLPTSPYGYEVIEGMNEGWQFMSVLCHGAPDRYSCLAAYHNQAPKSHMWGDRERLDGSKIKIHDGALTDLYPQCPWVTYSISCDVGWIDWSMCPFGVVTDRSERCVAVAGTLIPGRANAAYMANSRWGWVSTSYKLMKTFYEMTFTGTGMIPYDNPYDLRIGILHGMHKTEHPNYRDLIYGHLLLGDPAMRVWTYLPKEFTVSVLVIPPEPPGSGPSTVIIHTCVPGSQVCLRYPPQDFYEVQESDEDGKATFTVILSNAGKAGFSVTDLNYIPFQGNL